MVLEPMRRLLLCCLLAVVSSAAQPQDTGRPRPEFPPDWSPAGLEGVHERVTGAAAEVYRAVGSVEVTVGKALRCRVGYREELPILLSKRSSADKRVTIVGAGPRGITLDTTAVRMRKRLGRVTPAVQTLLTHDAHLLLKLTIAKEEGVLPVRLEPEPTYPTLVLGGLPTGLGEPDREAALLASLDLPAQCLRLPGEDADSWLPLLRQRAEFAPEACLEVDLTAQGWEDHLRQLAAEHGDLVRFWQLQAPPPLPTGDEEPDAGAVARFAQSLRRAADIVHRAAPAAVVLSPTLRAWTADTAAQARLVRALMQQQRLGLGGLVVAYAPPAVPAQEAGAETWAQMDQAADLAAVRQAIGTDPRQEMGIWWVRHGPAGGDERLEALRMVRDAVLAASAGAIGLEYRPPQSAEAVWRPEGAASDEAIAAMGEAMAELAGATPSWEWGVGDGYCSSQAGSPVTVRSFVRGDEGTVFLWSNAPKRVEFRLALRQEPLGLRTLTLSPQGTLIERKTDLAFIAQARNKEGHYLVEGSLAPLEMRAYSFPLRGAHRAWLATVRRR